MPLPKNKPVIVLPPPRLSVNKLSDKYQLVVDISWGENERQVKISNELPSVTWNLLNAVNYALLELAEKEPYIIQ